MTSKPRTRFRKRWVVVPILLLALLAGGLYVLVSTPAGARFFARLVMRREPRLALHVDGGTLRHGLQLSNVAWKDVAAEITLDTLTAEWELAFTPKPAIRIRTCQADGLHVALPSTPAADKPATPPAPFRLPFLLDAEAVRIRQIEILAEHFTARLDKLALAGTFHGDTLDLAFLRLATLSVHDNRPAPPPPNPAVPWFERLDPSQREPIQLPDIRPPLNFNVEAFTLDRAAYTRGTRTWRLVSLLVSAKFTEQNLEFRRFRLKHQAGSVTGQGKIRLTDGYPLTVSVNIEDAAILPNHPVSVSASFRHRLEHLAYAIRLDGPGTLEATGTIRPLDPRLPLKSTLTWTNLAWPLDGEPVAASESGTLQVEGSLDACSLELDGRLRGASIPAGHWNLQAKGTLRELTCQPLRGEWLGGSLQTTGLISWTNGLTWDLAVQADRIDGNRIHAAAPSNLTGQVHSTGLWQNGEWGLELTEADLSGDWKAYPFILQGRLAGSPRQGWNTPDLTIGVQDNSLHLTGTFADELDLTGKIHLPQPDALVPGLSGTLAGTWSLKGPLRQPDAVLALQATNLAYRAARISAARLDANIASLAASDSRLLLEIDSLILTNRPHVIENLNLAANGTRARHQISLEINGAPVRLNSSLQGSLDDSTLAWTGDLRQAGLVLADLDWTLQAPISLNWNPDRRQLTAAPHRWRHNAAELHVPEPLVLGATGSAKLDLSGFDLTEFHSWLPRRLRVQGTLGASADVQWSDKSIQTAAAALDIHQAAVRLIRPPSDLFDDHPPIDIAYDTVHLDSQWGATNWATRLELASDHLGTARGETHIVVTPNRTLGDWSGQVELDAVKLELLAPFLTSLRTFAGELDASVRLSGDPRHPRLHGTFALTNGLVEPMDWPLRLGDIHLQGNLRGEQADLTGGFRSGDGMGTLAGRLEIADHAWDATLQLAGDRLDLSYDSFAVFQASPDLTLRIAPGRFALAGRILIPQAEITIRKLPDSAVKISPDAAVIQPATAGTTNGTRNGISAWDRSIDIELQLGDQVALSGYGLSALLGGQLRIRQTGTAAPGANGEIRLDTGDFDAYGQKLSIRTGQFLFAGPLNRPTLYVEAVREVPDYLVTVGLRVEGPVDALRTSLFSQPTMPDEQILPYLLMGRPLERGDGGAADGMLASAALSLGLARGGGRAASLAESAGIENFQVGTQGRGEDTEVVVSGDVSPRLQVSYGSSVFGEGTTLTLRYRLARNLFLESVSSLVSSLELLYSFAY